MVHTLQPTQMSSATSMAPVAAFLVIASTGQACMHQACPTAAITYVDANWTGYDGMRQWAASTDNQLGA